MPPPLPRRTFPAPAPGRTGDLLDLLKLGAIFAYAGGFVSDTVGLVAFFAGPALLLGAVVLAAKLWPRRR